MPSHIPLVSIITIVKNNASLVGQCLASTEEILDDPNFEHIVLDGGSTDGTQDIISTFEHINWVSDNDAGIYDAFNKGVIAARGEWLIFLNSDDVFISGALKNIKAAAIQYADSELVSFKSYRRQGVNQPVLEKYLHYWWVNVPFNHCASLIKRDLFQKFGHFLPYKYAMDAEWLLRIHRKIKMVHCEEPVLIRSLGGITDSNRLRAYSEYLSVSKVHYPVLRFFGFSLKVLVLIRNKVRNFFSELVKGTFFLILNELINRIPIRRLRLFIYHLASGGKISRDASIALRVIMLNPRGISIGPGTVINEGTLLDGRGANLVIGSGVDIGRRSMVWTLGHDYRSPMRTDVAGLVVIQDNSWVMPGCQILPGAVLGMGCVLFSGSVARGVLDRSSFYSGVPASKVVDLEMKSNDPIHRKGVRFLR